MVGVSCIFEFHFFQVFFIGTGHWESVDASYCSLIILFMFGVSCNW